MNQSSIATTPQEIYGEAGLIYIRYNAEIEVKENGQKKIKDTRPPFSKIQKQIEYKAGAGKFYSLLMGREIKPGRFVILLDFDNKVEGESRSGLDLAKKLKMDNYNAPKQTTPSKGLHYLFYVDREQAEHIKSRTGLTYDGVNYNADVKFKNSLCNCAPSKIEGYGDYKWVNPSKLKNIPKLPEEIYNIIKTKATRKTTSTSATGTATAGGEAPKATRKQLEDITALCSCLTAEQMDNYATWRRVGMIMKRLGAPLSLWEEVSKKSKKWRDADRREWDKFPAYNFNLGSLAVLAKSGDIDEYERLKPTLHDTKDVFDDDSEHPCTVINTPFLTTKSPDAVASNPDQWKFKSIVDEFMTNAQKKTLVLKSRSGSGKTTFMQRLIKEKNPARVLFITYRQTLARDIMRNFGKLGFKNYLDSYDNPRVWESPRLIVQVDSLLNLIYRNEEVVSGEAFQMDYDMIVLDESESLLCHFDEKTMENKEICIWRFFDELLKHSKKMVLMDGDMSERSLSFASSYGEMDYVRNDNNETNKSLNIICDATKWERQLHGDIERFHGQDPKFRVAVVSQSSTQALSLEEDLRQRFPSICVRRLVGLDSGETKKQFLEDINKSLEEVNVFIYSPVIESGVDITIPVKKLYGVLSAKSNSQRAYLQMLARCRNVEDGRIDIMNAEGFKINNNHCFWKYKEVLELNKQTVAPTMPYTITGNQLRLVECVDTRRKNISVVNQVERKNKNPILFLNYLRLLAANKGMGFTIDQEIAEAAAEARAKEPRTNYKLQSILQAKDLTHSEYEEIAARKKRGKTTTEENFQAERFYWQRYLAQAEPEPELLLEFMYDTNPLNNFLGLVDLRNHEKEDNLRSAKFVERVETVRKLLNALGFANALDREKIEKDTFLENWAAVVEDDAFHNKRLNELWNLTKTRRIDKDMNGRQILPWINTLIKPFGLAIKSDHGKYKLTERFDILGLIRRKNARGRFYEDAENLLGQVSGEGDPFIDEVTGETLIQKRERVRRETAERRQREFDTSRLDEGVSED